MKMQKPKPTSSQWMEDICFHFVDTSDDEDDDNCFEPLDSVSAYTPGDTDTDVCGPYSVTSCPPSVGPDQQDVFLPTPHKMYAPTSPVCVKPPSFPDSGHHHPTDDDHHVLSLEKAHILCDQATLWQTDSDQTNVDSGCIIFGREHAQKAARARLDNDVSRTVTDMDNLKQSFLRGESSNIRRTATCSSFEELENAHRKQSVHEESPNIRRTATCSSFEELENAHRKQSIQEESPNDRRISWDEFISLDNEVLLAALQGESQISPGRNGSLQMVEASNAFLNEAAKSRNVKTPEQSKTTNHVRKRPAQELIFSNPDFFCSDNEIPFKRQMVVAGQADLMPHFKDRYIYNPDSIVDEMCGRVDLAPDVHTINSTTQRPPSAGQNPVNNFLASSIASLRHDSLSDTGQFGQAVQEPHTSSVAPTTSPIFTIDHNGNLVPTDSHATGSLINPWVVETESIPNQHTAFTDRNGEPRLQIQQLTMSGIPSTQPDTALVSVPLENLPGHLDMAAASTTNPPQQIIHKLPDYHLSTLRSTDAQNDSTNQNFRIANQNRLSQQETASNQHTSPTGLVYQDSQTSVIRHPDVGVCNREATTPATTTTPKQRHREVTRSPTTTTLRHDAFGCNENCHRQEMDKKSHLFNPSAGTDPFPAGTDPFPAGTDPFPAGTDPFPVGTDPFPTGSDPFPAGTDPFPVGTDPFPAGTDPFPAGTDPFPAGTDPFPAGTGPFLAAINHLLREDNHSDISHLPVDHITAQMFTSSSSTDDTSLYQTSTFSNTTSALQDNQVIYTHVVMASDDVVESLPGNSRFNTTSTSVFGYHDTDIVADPQECNNTDPGTSYRESCTPDELIQGVSGVVDNHNAWNLHVRATDRDDRINGITSQTEYGPQPDITAADLVGGTVSAVDGHQFTFTSPYGSTYANDDIDYLLETNEEHFSASRSSYDPSHFSATDAQNPVFDAFFEAVSPHSETTFVCGAERNVVTDASSVADSASRAVDLAGVTDSALVGAHRKSGDVAQKSDIVKQGLKHAILIKRQKEGKEDIDISYQPQGQHELNEDEQEQVVRRKELNRKAAAVHRQKKKTSKETQDKEFDDLMKTNSQLKQKVAQVESQKENIIKLLQGLGYQFR